VSVWLTFERWQQLTRWLPASVRCRLHAHLPARLERQAWEELSDEVEAMRATGRDAGMEHISESLEAELERLRQETP
jgi:hypothetical protein